MHLPSISAQWGLVFLQSVPCKGNKVLILSSLHLVKYWINNCFQSAASVILWHHSWAHNMVWDTLGASKKHLTFGMNPYSYWIFMYLIETFCCCWKIYLVACWQRNFWSCIHHLKANQIVRWWLWSESYEHTCIKFAFVFANRSLLKPFLAPTNK